MPLHRADLYENLTKIPTRSLRMAAMRQGTRRMQDSRGFAVCKGLMQSPLDVVFAGGNGSSFRVAGGLCGKSFE
ncbi:hypothetical protein [Rhizobium sp. NFR03]|uniref:hypothetical protein n=1 Tax=Rhizobium sp. NFR03 TaxID=1566263 RepID=UPI001114E8E1|nr:hypothetical protein [Rhizobium sp. NFR03]